MADIQPLRTLRYDTSVAGPLERPDRPSLRRDRRRACGPSWRAASPYNVVEIDLPESYDGARPQHARRSWRERGRARPGGRAGHLGAAPGLHRPRRQRRAPAPASSRACAWRTTAPGASGPHERTHPGPKEDRLSLTRATRANLSPIFSLFPDPSGAARETLGAGHERRAVRRGDRRRGHAQHALAGRGPGPIAALQGALADAELLIADGHHRYETARVYADEVGGEGDHRYVLMLLVRARGPGPPDLPHPPPAHRPEGRRRQADRDPRRGAARLRDRGAGRPARARAAGRRTTA